MRKKLFVISFILLAGSIIFVALSFMTPARRLHEPSAVSIARELYAFSKSVPLSQQAGPTLVQIAAARAECYRLTAANRLETCNRDYLNSIVAVGKETSDSAPDMGAFVGNVSRCPVVHSLCMGERSDFGQCIRQEALCIEGMLDRHWRGRPFQGR